MKTETCKLYSRVFWKFLPIFPATGIPFQSWVSFWSEMNLSFKASILWYCWLALLTCKNCLPYNLYCVGGDVKHCTIQSNPTIWHQVDTKHTHTYFVLLCTQLLFSGLTVWNILSSELQVYSISRIQVNAGLKTWLLKDYICGWQLNFFLRVLYRQTFRLTHHKERQFIG